MISPPCRGRGKAIRYMLCAVLGAWQGVLGALLIWQTEAAQGKAGGCTGHAALFAPLESIGGEIWGTWPSPAHISVQVSVRA